MQERNLTELIGSAFDRKRPKEKVKKELFALSAKNKLDLADKNLPDYMRTPTPEELNEMREWAIDYKKTFKRASKRQVRIATQKHFHIRIFK